MCWTWIIRKLVCKKKFEWEQEFMKWHFCSNIEYFDAKWTWYLDLGLVLLAKLMQSGTFEVFCSPKLFSTQIHHLKPEFPDSQMLSNFNFLDLAEIQEKLPKH